MRPLDDKRVTKIQFNQVAFLPQSVPESGRESSPEPEPKFRVDPLQLGPRPKNSSAIPSTSEQVQKVNRDTPMKISLQQDDRLGNIISTDLVVRDESPWVTFEHHYDCDLAGTVAVCVRSSGSRAVRAIRKYPSKDADKILEILRSTCHKNVASTLECFRTPDALYAISDFDPLTLDHIVACNAFPGQLQLAAIMSQFLDGLSYLAAQQFHHTSLDCSSVLMNLKGEVKIARIDKCIIRQADRLRTSNLTLVSRVMMELMQGYAKEDGAVGIDNLDRWQACPAALEFLSATTSASSFEELKKERLLTEIRWCPADLIGLAWFALISARTFYSYTPQAINHR